MLKSQHNQNLECLRHSLAHLLAAAVLELWPETKRTIGPAIEDGFYYDFDFVKPISDGDLPRIERKMREILKTWDKFSKETITPAQARKEFAKNPYKLELIKEFSKEGQKLTLYKFGNYVDLCRGGHVESAQKIDPLSFKLTKLAGAYWRGDEKNKMLTRIYGLAFASKKELNDYLKIKEEANRRDHKKLGSQLDLFTFSDLVGPGLPLWTPKGTLLRNILDNFVWTLREKRGYQKVEIPHITKKELYETSGHWDKFKDELFRIKTREGHEFAMKPMNCPHHTQIYARRQWSYRELPQRYANTTTCYRDEQTGELSGLARVRAFAQDDAHVFCRMTQAKEEFLKIWDIVHEFYSAFGFQMRVRLSLHDPKQPEKYLGEPARWKRAEGILREIVNEKSIRRPADWFEGIGEAAFYGPKLDFMAKDALGREWQLATIQLDLNMPERFDLSCKNEKGENERIVMIHAAIMGAIERFLAILIEHTAGAFPFWLSPVQVAVLPINDRVEDYSLEVLAKLKNSSLRAELDTRSESIGKKIREAELQKTPYLLIVGDKEVESQTVAVRTRGKGDQGVYKLSEFLKTVQKENL